jgi:hypothetical protein
MFEAPLSLIRRRDGGGGEIFLTPALSLRERE